MKAQPEVNNDLIRASHRGLVCEAGDFVIDPWKKTHTSLITHAHADHARPVADRYFAAKSSLPLLKKRLGEDINIQGVDWGQQLRFGETLVSFHPAGHVLGSAQIRVERPVENNIGNKAGSTNGKKSEVWVFTGDFKRDYDPSCEPFELVPCDTLITEATFALPVYRWQSGSLIAEEIHHWWQQMKKAERPAVLFCYSLGKAQRVLAELTNFTDDSVFLHGAIAPLSDIYRDAGVNMLAYKPVDLNDREQDYRGQLIIAPPGASGSAWMKRFKNASTGFCSGWMRVRGNRRRRGFERGFVLSDHADWPGLLDTIAQTGATRVLTTHGQASSLVRLLQERGINASELRTRYSDNGGDDSSEDSSDISREDSSDPGTDKSPDPSS